MRGERPFNGLRQMVVDRLVQHGYGDRLDFSENGGEGSRMRVVAVTKTAPTSHRPPCHATEVAACFIETMQSPEYSNCAMVSLEVSDGTADDATCRVISYEAQFQARPAFLRAGDCARSDLFTEIVL